MQFGSRSLDLSSPKIMGVLNVTPDSFYDGGRYYAQSKDISSALRRAEAMVAAGAHFIDIGGESTRPGAEPVSVQEEMDRVLPVVEALGKSIDSIISLDTSSPEVMREGSRLGAGVINDVRALTREGAIEAAYETGLPVCLMHMQGSPKTMQRDPTYDDVINQVREYFQTRMQACRAGNIGEEKLLLDPGFGFGKKDEHNLALLRRLNELRVNDCPLLVGLSRKSMLGRLLGRETEERLAGSLALAQYALQFGANILRVHDVAETRDVLRLFEFIGNE